TAHYDRDGITPSAAAECEDCKMYTEQIIYTTSDGFSLSDASKWTLTNNWPGYNGSIPTYWGCTEGEYAQYKPHNLVEGWYDVYFWNMKCYDQQNPVKMTATIYSNGTTITNIPLEVTTATVDKEGTWTKIGTYYFKGTNDEYMRLVANGESNARPAEAKFVKNENYVPTEKVTFCHITTFSSGFTKSGTWNPGTFPDSTGNTTSGASYYGEVIGSYTQYTPFNLEPGWYDISFWNLKYQDHQDPMKMTGTVYSNGELTTNIPLSVSTATVDRTGAWTKVGTYYFDGSNTEYFRLVSTYEGMTSRPSDVKFEKNNDYIPPVVLVTEQEIGYGDEGQTLSSESAWSATNWPSGTDYSKWHYYGNTLGEYVQYTPKNLEPGWYDITFWNMKCFEQQTPIKMTGTVHSNGGTKENIALETTTATTDGDGVWTKAGTFYFEGTNDEYFRLVSTGQTNARPANVRFVKNDDFVPPPSIGNEKLTLENENGVWSAEANKGTYTLTVEKTALSKQGLLALYVNGDLVDKQYASFDKAGIYTYGTYDFNQYDAVELKYLPLTSDSTVPAGKIYFEPAGAQYVKYELINNQRNKTDFFFEAGKHTVKAYVTNNSGSDKTYQMTLSLTDMGDIICRTTGDKVKYNEMNKLVMGEKVTVANGETEELTLSVPIEKITEDTKLKAFVWSDIATMIPVF
ncbi:MAG: hypothetical protein IJN39_05690, partial [Clostridia bacterium]|nr:hypothetical protein [Clostridia bacterium]